MAFIKREVAAPPVFSADDAATLKDLRQSTAALVEQTRELQERVIVLERWKGTPFVRVLFATIAVFCLAPLATFFWLWILGGMISRLLGGR